MLTGRTVPGDCGAWIVNAITGDIYGHIVAGDPVSGMAYIVPAHKVFDDVERRHGARPSLLGDTANDQFLEIDFTGHLRHQPGAWHWTGFDIENLESSSQL